jgi:hypothetical protein
VGTAQGAADNVGLFRADAAGVVPIARAGQAVGSEGIISSVAGSLGNAALNEAGQVAFPAVIALNGGGSTTAIFRSDGTAQTLTQIVGQGQALPTGNGVYGPLYLVGTPPTLNNAGQVVFSSRIDSASNGQTFGLFRGDGVSVIPIELLFSPAPDGTLFGSLTAGPVLNDSGTVALTTTLYQTNRLALGSALAVTDGPSAAFYGQTGQSTPDGQGTFNTARAPYLNDVGQAAFVASVQTAGSAFTALYFVSSSGAVTEVARTGNPVPGLTGENLVQFEWLTLNNSGQLAFTARTCCHAGVFLWNPATGVIRSLAVSGQGPPDGNGVINVVSGSATSPVELNDSGEAAFASFITGSGILNDFGVFFYDDKLGLVQAARYGDPLLGSTINQLNLATGASKAYTAGTAAGRAFSPLNNRGQLAYSFVLADGRSGVAVWTMPSKPQARVTALTRTKKDTHISWSATAGVTSVVQASTNAGGRFVDISGNIPPGPATNTFVEVGGATNGPTRFYRIRLAP